MAWYRGSKSERVREYRAKQRQKALLTSAGVLGVAGGLARAPWAAKHAVRAAGKVSPQVARGVARVPASARTRLADVEAKGTAASVPLAIGSGALGSTSSLVYAGRLKREAKKEGQKLGIDKSLAELAVVAKRAGEPEVSWRAGMSARNPRNNTWREEVSPAAVAAHDKALPPYAQRYARQGLAGMGVAAGLGTVAYGAGRSAIRSAATGGGRAKVAAKGSLAALSGLASVPAAAYAGERGMKAQRIEGMRRAIRARGHQRRLDAVG